MKEQFKKIKPYKLASHKIWSVSDERQSDILKLDWNEATIQPSPMVKEAIMNFVEKNVFNYYPATNNDKLIHALANYIGINDNNIQYFASSDSLHEYIAQMYINDGDIVVIVWPSYDNFRVTAEINGAEIEYFRLSDGFTLKIEKFIEFLKEKKPVLVYMCNPNNPTGTIQMPETIENYLKMFPDTMFLIDEAYADFSKVSCKDLVNCYNNIIISRTMSKAFALANFRFGYMISSKENVDNVNTIRNAKNISSLSQVAVLAALNDIQYVNDYVNEVNKSKSIFVDKLKGIKNIQLYAGQGNFVMIEFPSYDYKIKLIDFLEKHNIFVRNLQQDESVRNCIRVTVGTREQMIRVAQVIREGLN